jgi:hypothetical protein
MDPKYYSTISISAIIAFLVIAYVIYVKFYEGHTESFEEEDATSVKMIMTDTPDCVQRSKYVTDMYPWWRSTRWTNVDGWLYSAPFWNYWRRPQYYSAWINSKPTIIGGKRFYARSFY